MARLSSRPPTVVPHQAPGDLAVRQDATDLLEGNVYTAVADIGILMSGKTPRDEGKALFAGFS
jgi:hypothetical protein